MAEEVVEGGTEAKIGTWKGGVLVVGALH